MTRLKAILLAALLAAQAVQAGCDSQPEERPDDAQLDWIEQWRDEIKEHQRLSRERTALLPKYLDMFAGEDSRRFEDGASGLLMLEKKEKGFVYDRVLELLPEAVKPGKVGKPARSELLRIGQIIRLASEIETGDRAKWVETAESLRLLGRPGEAAASVKLILKLKSENMLDIAAAQEGLRALGIRAVKFLIEAIRSEFVRQAVKQRCVDVLSSLGKEAAVPLRQLIADPKPNVRYMGAAALGALRDREAVPALSEALGREDNALVACAMLKALGDTGDSAAAPQVRKMIDSDDVSIVKFASAAAAALDDKQALPALASALGRAGGDPDPMVKEELLKALRKLSGRNFGDDAAKWKAAFAPGGR